MLPSMNSSSTSGRNSKQRDSSTTTTNLLPSLVVTLMDLNSSSRLSLKLRNSTSLAARTLFFANGRWSSVMELLDSSDSREGSTLPSISMLPWLANSLRRSTRLSLPTVFPSEFCLVLLDSSRSTECTASC